MKKRIFAVMLAALLSLSVLAGCGDNGDDTPTTTTTEATTTTTTEDNTSSEGDETTTTGDETTTTEGDETTTTSEETTTTKDGKKTTTKRTTTTTKDKKTTTTEKTTTTTKGTTTTAKKDEPAASGMSMPFEETQTWKLFLNEHAYQPIKENSPKFDYIYELTNVDLQVDVGSGGNSKTKLMAAAASGKMYDIASLQNSAFRTYKTSLFYDLTDKINEKDLPNYYAAVKPYWNDLMLYATGGKLYGFAAHQYGEDEPWVLSPYIRVDILEDENIKKPTTWKEWFEAMKKLKNLYPGSQPFASRQASYILDYWTQMLGQHYNIYYNAEANKWECGVLNAAKFKNILQFMIDCYKEGILDANFDGSSEGNFQSLATSSNTFFTIDSGSPTSKANAELQKTNKNARFIAITPFSSHLNGNKTTSYCYTKSGNYSQMYFISSQAKNMDKLLYFMDWCYTQEGAFTNNFGKLGVTYEVDKDGEAYVPKSVWKKWENAEDKSYKWMSDIGLGQLCFAPMFGTQTEPWEDYEFYPQSDYKHDWQGDPYAEYDKGYASKRFTLSPDVEQTLVQRYDDIRSYIYMQIVSFVKGERDITEYDTFVNDLKNMGIEDLLKACNA
ncbi:MAG: extracellular solute-binding protein [Clostridia bacterium]|nr:extracellular solute-binding protein [Clostridia bacterium]